MPGSAADFDVSLEVRPQGFVAGTRAVNAATKELTESTRASGAASRETASAEDRLAEAERRRIQAAAELVRSYRQRIAVLAEYQRSLAAGSSAEAARASGQVASTGVDPNSQRGVAMQALIEKERQLRQAIRETAEEAARADRVAANISALQQRTAAMREALAAAQKGEAAERSYAEALQVAHQIAATGAKPGTEQAAAVEREVIAQKRLEEELRAVAAARERDEAAARAANAQRERVSDELTRLRETTSQLEILAAAHRRGGSAVQQANVQLEVRNALLRAGVAAGSADAAAIEGEVRAQARLRVVVDESTNAERRQESATQGLRNAFFALQGLLATLGLSALIRDSVQVALALDRANKSLFAVTGSQAGASREMAFVSGEANRLGLVLTDTAQAYAGLTAASKGTTLEGQATRDIFSAVAESATVMGLSAEQSQGALLAIQQMMSKGTVQAEELRGQLGERLPGAFGIAARAMGVTTAQLGKMLEGGKVMAADLLPKLAVELRKTFGPGLANAVDSAQANLNRFRNDLDQLKASLGRGFLSGFLAGFKDLRGALTDASLAQAARDLGESIGKALRVGADAAAFLAKNLDLVKTVLLALLAIKAALYFSALGARIVGTADSLTILLRGMAALNAAMAALPMLALIALLAALVVSMQSYASAQRLALNQELERVQHSQEVIDYYTTLKAKTDALTESERAYGLEVRKNLEARLAELRSNVPKIEYQVQHGFSPADTADARDRLEQTRREIETTTNEIHILESQWNRLGLDLATAKTPVIDTKGLDKTGQKIADLIQKFKMGAEEAERLAAAQRRGADAAQAEQLAVDREKGAWEALHQIHGISAKDRERLTALIEGYIGRTQVANQQSAVTIALRERDLEYSREAQTAEAALADAISNTSAAGREMAAQLAAEAIARSDFRSEDAAYIKDLKSGLLVRAEYLASIQNEIEWINRQRQAAIEQRQLEAQLTDARRGDTVASRELVVALEAEEEARKRGIAQGTLAYNVLLAIIGLRERDADATRAQQQAQERLNASRLAEQQGRAEVADWQTQTAFAQRYGSELAGILNQYGLLAGAVEEVRIQEEIRQAIVAAGVNPDRAAIEADIRGQHQRIAAIKAAWAAADIKRWVYEPFHQAWDSVKREGLDALNEFVITGKLDFDSLWKSFLKQGLEAIEQWLIRWITANRTAQAVSAQTAAANAAAGNAGLASGYGVTGGSSSGGFVTGAGGAGAAGGSSAGASAGAAVGWAVIIAIWAKVLTGLYEGFTRKRVAYGEAGLGPEGTVTERGNSKLAGEAATAMRALIKQIEGLAKEWHLGLVKLTAGSVSIGKNSAGEFVVKTLLDGYGRVFKSLEAAQEYATVQALKFAQYAKETDAIVVAAAHASRAETVAGYKEDIDFAQRLATGGLDEIAQRMRGFLQTMVDDFHHALDLFGSMQFGSNDFSQLGAATSAVLLQFSNSIQALYDELTGHKQDETQLAESRRIAYNAQRAIMIAQIILLYEEIKARIAAYQVYLATGRGAGTGGGGGVFGPPVNPGKPVAGPATKEGGALPYDARNPANDPGLQALLQVLDNLARALQGLPPEIAQGGVKVPHGGGGRGAGGGGQSLMEQVVEARRQRELSQMSQLAQALAAVNDKWDKAIKEQGLHSSSLAAATRRHEEAIKAANGNAAAIKAANEAYARQTGHIKASQEALRAANEERERELALIRQQATTDLYGKVKDWEKDPNQGSTPQGQVQQIQEQGQVLRDEFLKTAKELHFGAARIAAGLGRIDAATAARVASFTKQFISGLGLPLEQARDKAKAAGDTVAFLRDRVADGTISLERFNEIMGELGEQAGIELLGMAAALLEQMGRFDEADQARRAADELNFHIQRIQFNILLDQYELLGFVTGDLRVRLEGLRGILNNSANWPDFTQPAPSRSGNDGHEGQIWTGAGWVNGPGTNTAANPLLDAARRFASAVDDYVQATQDLMADPALSPLSPEEQRASLEAQFMAAAAAARGGDATAAARLADLQRQTLEAAIREFGGGVDAQGNAGYLAVLQRLLAAGQGVVNSAAATSAFNLAATVTATGEQQHRDLTLLQSIMQGLRDDLGGTVLYNPNAFSAAPAPARTAIGGDALLNGGGAPPAPRGDASIELLAEVRALRRELAEREGPRARREEKIVEATDKTAKNTAGDPYPATRQQGRFR